MLLAVVVLALAPMPAASCCSICCCGLFDPKQTAPANEEPKKEQPPPAPKAPTPPPTTVSAPVASPLARASLAAGHIEDVIAALPADDPVGVRLVGVQEQMRAGADARTAVFR